MTGEKALYINIDRDFMIDGGFSSQDKFVYMIIKSMSFSNLKSYNALAPISTEVILSMMGFSLNTKNKNSIKDTLDDLIDCNMIEVFEDFLATRRVEDVKLSKTYFVRVIDDKLSNKYTRIYQEEAYKLMTMVNKSKAKVFTVFMEIVSYIYQNESSDRYCYPSLETIGDNTGINCKTIMNYIKVLYEEEMLYHETYKVSKGRSKNVYSRWKDRECVQKYVLDH